MSPFTVDQSVLGLEGIHRINDELDMNAQGVLPRIKLDRISGLHSMAEIDDNREPMYGQGGERTYTSLARGKTVTYEGRVIAADLYTLREHARDFRLVCSHGRLLGTTEFVVRPNPAVGGPSHRFEGRVLSLDIDDEQIASPWAVPTPWQRSFILTVRQADPRYYLVGADVTAGAASGATVEVDNVGNAPAQPVFVVNGPVADELLFHRLDNFGDVQLLYDDVGLASGQQLRLDFANRTLRRVSDNESFEHKRVFEDSDWWDAGVAGLNEGVTHVVVSGGGAWTISFSPASW